MRWAPAQLWLPPAWGWGFFARCALLRLSLVLGPPALLVSRGYGILALLAMIALSLWPFPRSHRLRVTKEGLRVRHLFVDTLIPAADIERTWIEGDPRRWVLGQRKPVLRIRRRSGATLMVFAPIERLRELCEELEAQLAHPKAQRP